VGVSETGVAGRPAAKGAVLGLTKALAADGAAYGIKVNAVMPVGYTRMAAAFPDDDLRAMLEKHFSVDQVTPVAAWLVPVDNPRGC
jgi:NAD(P)-dependent dehydrogenase (short-subunit alcohol dehydrogenase family)